VILLRFIIPLFIAATTALGQLAQQNKPPSAPEQAEAMVKGLYSEVIARHPNGIPNDAGMKIFSPYLSKSLLHRIDSAIACSRDEARQHPDPNSKPEIAWLEFGLFTGILEKVSPRAFRVLGAEPGKNVSFRVYVELIIIFGLPANPEPLVWHVAAVVIRENGQFVVDDVVFLKDYVPDNREFRLSDVLREGCKGPRWVGFGKPRKNPGK
jgi:hypothetical protein